MKTINELKAMSVEEIQSEMVIANKSYDGDYQTIVEEIMIEKEMELLENKPKRPYREVVEINKDTKISIVKWSENNYELAILYRTFGNDWDIDYSVYDDVLKAESSMEVYGTIKMIMDDYSEHYPNMEIAGF